MMRIMDLSGEDLAITGPLLELGLTVNFFKLELNARRFV